LLNKLFGLSYISQKKLQPLKDKVFILKILSRKNIDSLSFVANYSNLPHAKKREKALL